MIRFEWDEEKAKTNLRKHKISFEEAESIFNDYFLVTYPDDFHSIGEERFISIGFSNVSTFTEIGYIENRNAGNLACEFHFYNFNKKPYFFLHSQAGCLRSVWKQHLL